MNYKNLIEEFLDPHIERIINLVAKEGKKLQIADTLVFNEKAQFTNGKVVNGVAYLLERGYDREKSDKILKEMLEYPFETWGILNSLFGFLRLHKKGILESSINSEVLEIYRDFLTTETFLDSETLKLKDKPTNYYGVAFGIAAIREILGWKNSVDSKKIFERLSAHIEQYSGEYEFMDETEGDGRFDRYSFLIPAEICHLLEITGHEIPNMYKRMLKKSAKLMLSMANEDGKGFPYGRSIGAYGDTAIIEVLSIASKIGILSEDELNLAYLYNLKGAERVAKFWYDKKIDSLNFWLDGRETDSYRNINRILGENLSIPMQLLTGYNHYAEIGIEKKHFDSSEYHNLIDKLVPKETLKEIKLMDGEYPKKVYTYKLGKNMFLIPFINGGKKYYKTAPYFPIPHCVEVIDSPIDEFYSQLMPEITLKNERKVILSPFFYKIEKIGETIEAHFDRVTDICGESPTKHSDVSECENKICGVIKYEFSKEGIKIYFEINKGVENIENIEMKYLESEKSLDIELLNFDNIRLIEKNKNYKSAIGFFRNEIRAAKSDFGQEKIEFSYILKERLV